jgi:hypothetical protein
MRLATFAGKLDRAAVVASAPPYHGNQAACGVAEQIRGYLGQEDEPVPYPLALGPGTARDGRREPLVVAAGLAPRPPHVHRNGPRTSASPTAT